MSRRNALTTRSGKVTPQLLKDARELVSGWDTDVQKYTKRKRNTTFNGIDNNFDGGDEMYKPITADSVTMAICSWIQQTPEWRAEWAKVRERWPNSAFLQKGYNKFVPNLDWLFRERGVFRVLQGRYDKYTLDYKPKTKPMATDELVDML